MILPDINLLIHAHNSHSQVHDAARDWWDRCLAGTEGIVLPWVVILGFIRITTHPKVFLHPMTPNEACERVDEWLTLPQVQTIEPPAQHFALLHSLLQQLGTAGNLTTDAHLAALAIGRGLCLHSTDSDFARFPKLKWINPLA